MNKNERIEEVQIQKIEEAYTKVTRKFRKRVENINNTLLEGGYESLSELWNDFGPIIQKTIHLSLPIQRLLNYTGDFHDFCESFKEDECKEYFDAMDFAWSSVLKQHPTSNTEKVRIMNVLRDGQDRASNQLGLNNLVYSRSMDILDEEDDDYL